MLSMEWLGAWWRAFGGSKNASNAGRHRAQGTSHQLHIVIVVRDQQLVGVLPCYLHEARLGRQLRFLGSGSVCSDYLGPVVEPSCAADVYGAIRQHLFQSVTSGELRDVESFQFEGISADDAWHSSLTQFVNEASFSMRTQPMVNSWSLDLPSSWAELTERQRGHGVHRKAKKCMARLQSNELQIRQLVDERDLDFGVKQLIRLHQARRESVGDRGCFADLRFEIFLRDALAHMLAERTACFTLCEKDDQVIGVQLLLLGSHTVFMYQSGVDPNYLSLEPGHAVVTGSLLYAIYQGYIAYDFLRGDEPYKSFWGAHPRPLQRIIMASPAFKAQAIEVVQRNLSWLRSRYNDLSGSNLSKS